MQIASSSLGRSQTAPSYFGQSDSFTQKGSASSSLYSERARKSAKGTLSFGKISGDLLFFCLSLSLSPSLSPSLLSFSFLEL